MTLKIVADENIPFVRELFSSLGDLHVLPGRELTNKDVMGCNILLVRSVTKVDQALLENSKVEFVGTCTIGTDHLNTKYLAERGITYTSAPGCNASAVVQYVLAVLAELNEIPVNQQKNVVIVGGGNVGSRVYDTLSAIGLNCHIVDPFLEKTNDRNMVEFAALDSADIICLHAPLTKDGSHPTCHMINESVLLSLKKNAVLISAGRGAVIHNQDLSSVLTKRSDLRVILDVWENEPNINTTLLRQIVLGTPHIAGYSFEGRLNGAVMVYDALTEYLEVPLEPSTLLRDDVISRAMGNRERLQQNTIRDVILACYSPSRDDAELRNRVNELPESFDWMRKHYPVRREFPHYIATAQDETTSELFRALGFKDD